MEEVKKFTESKENDTKGSTFYFKLFSFLIV